MNIPIFYESYAFPLTQGHEGLDAGYDIKTPMDITVWAHTVCIIDTGIRINCPPGLACIVMNKSGLGAKGLSKTSELIDPGYVGNIKIALQFNGENEEPCYQFRRGEKIAQIMFVPFVYPKFYVLDDPSLLGESLRGGNGFGSTGK